jgi:FkbM family methyltransferase
MKNAGRKSEECILDAYLSEPTTISRVVRWLLAAKSRVVIFDIGACEGEDSIRYARMFTGGKIHSFEPLPCNQERVRRHFEQYDIRNATLVPVALSDRRGSAQFHVSSGRPDDAPLGEDWDYGNKSSSLLTPASDGPMHGFIKFEESITVECETLDAYCRSNTIGGIDFIHMDVQGAESLVLEGAKGMLPRTLSIWLEVSSEELYQGQKLQPEIEAFLAEQGFKLIFEEYLNVEGNQFYTNQRHLRGRLFALAYRLVWPMARRISRRLERIFPKRPAQ